MYTPTSQLAIVGTIIPTVDISLHNFLSVSWEILLPYTIFGIALMFYSQARLIRGQRHLKRQLNSNKK